MIFFLRHGPTTENRENRIQGQRPGGILLRETEQYLAGVIPLMRHEKIDVLLSSDLERAVQTRNMLLQFLQDPEIKVGLSPLLREKAMGFYEGMTWSQVPLEFREQRGKNTYDFRTFGGENDSDVRERVRQSLREFALRYDGKTVCCVTHAGWLQQMVLIADQEGILPDQWSNRTAIYEAGLGQLGQLKYLHSLEIKAKVELDEE